MDTKTLYQWLMEAADAVAHALEMNCRTEPGNGLLSNSPLLHSQVDCHSAGEHEFFVKLWSDVETAVLLARGMAGEFADTTTAGLLDVVRELANHVGGAIKRNWPGESLQLTTPNSRLVDDLEMLQPDAGYAVVTLLADGAPVLISLELPGD